MGDWPLSDVQFYTSVSINTITSNASAHTKGAWVEVHAALPYDVSMLMITKRYCACWLYVHGRYRNRCCWKRSSYHQ